MKGQSKMDNPEKLAT